jgi:hypothetical protein
MSDKNETKVVGARPRFWEFVAMFGFLSGMTGVAAYAFSSTGSLRIFSVLALVGLASWLGGSLLGFLFGVPRFQAGEAPNQDGSRIVPNTNLEQVSDWLTKIIIGATLVQLRDLSTGLVTLARAIGADLGAPASSTAAGAVILFFFFAGFMWGYLWCSLRIFREMADLIYNRATRMRAVSDPGPTS